MTAHNSDLAQTDEFAGCQLPIVASEELEPALLSRAGRLLTHIQHKIPPRLRQTICAEDVLQEVWIRAFRTYRPCSTAQLDAWLIKIADSQLISLLRRWQAQKRGRDWHRVQPGVRQTSYVDLLERARAPGHTPSGHVCAQEATHMVQVKLASLPTHYEQVIRLHHIEGKTVGEIAEAAQTTEGAVIGRLQRGLAMLRESLGRESSYQIGTQP